MKYKNLLQVATSRRSTRKFIDKAVARQDIERIVEVGVQSPSGFNSQPWHVVVVDDPQLKDQVSSLLLEGIGEGKSSKGFVDAPVFILLYGDTRVRQKGPIAKRDDESWWKFTFNTSLANAFMSMQLAATSLGLGSMWVSAFRNPAVEIPARVLLNIPHHLELFELMAVGYSAVELSPKKVKNTSDVIHYNGCDIE